MVAYIRKRLLLAIPTLLAVTFITFSVGYLAPGSPIDAKLKERNDPETRARLMREYGLDRPPLVQYGDYLWKAARGDLGTSITFDRKVSEIVLQQFPATAQLAGMAIALASLLGLSAGIVSALQHNRFLDRFLMGAVLLAVSLPTFVLAPLLMLVFVLWLGWLPPSGWDGPQNYILPVLVLGARPTALIARLMRSSMLEVMRQDYIRTAIAKGLSPVRVVFRHALKNAFLPVLTALGNSLGYLLTGSFVVETIFRVPGIGFESVDSIMRRDYPVIQGMSLLVAVVFILVNLTVDILYGMVDPRVRFEEAR